jgi:hypothetical protein
VGFIIVGGFWALFGLGALITGSASIGEDFILLSKHHARILGAATMVLGLVMVSLGVLAETGPFEPREIALGTFLVFFATVTVLFVIMAAVKLIRWARAGGGR